MFQRLKLSKQLNWFKQLNSLTSKESYMYKFSYIKTMQQFNARSTQLEWFNCTNCMIYLNWLKKINGRLSSLNGSTRPNSELAEILKLDKSNKQLKWVHWLNVNRVITVKLPKSILMGGRSSHSQTSLNGPTKQMHKYDMHFVLFNRFSQHHFVMQGSLTILNYFDP